MFLTPFLLLALPASLVAICPMENHQVCNEGYKTSCCCSIVQTDISSAPEQSCNQIIIRDLETEAFPVVSIDFNLDDKVEGLEQWPEESFRDTIAKSLRVDDEDIVILRASCKNTDDQLTIQFAVLKKDKNETELPYEVSDFIDAQSLASRIKAMGHLNRIADLDVDSVEFTDEMIDIEYEPDNADLVFEAFVVALSAFVAVILGVYYSCKNRDYADDLQKV